MIRNPEPKTADASSRVTPRTGLPFSRTYCAVEKKYAAAKAVTPSPRYKRNVSPVSPFAKSTAIPDKKQERNAMHDGSSLPFRTFSNSLITRARTPAHTLAAISRSDDMLSWVRI